MSNPPLDFQQNPVEFVMDALRVARAATQGPWDSWRDGNQYVETDYIPTAKCVGASKIPQLRRPWNPHALLAFGFKPREYETARFLDADADYIAKFDPPTVIALMEDWLRLREALQQVRDDSRTPAEIKIWCGAILAKQG